MAMNNKEQAEMEALREEVRLAKAFRFTEPVEPDIPIPHSYHQEDRTIGFLFNTNAVRINEACSTSIYHSAWGHDKTTTQGGRALYSTRVLALKAMRHELEKMYAKQLADIDAQIEKEKPDART